MNNNKILSFHIVNILCLIDDLVKNGAPFIIATYSPILISCKEGKILDLDNDFKEIKYEDSNIYKLYKIYLENYIEM